VKDLSLEISSENNARPIRKVDGDIIVQMWFAVFVIICLAEVVFLLWGIHVI
jgi:hypothetical protein